MLYCKCGEYNQALSLIRHCEKFDCNELYNQCINPPYWIRNTQPKEKYDISGFISSPEFLSYSPKKNLGYKNRPKRGKDCFYPFIDLRPEPVKKSKARCYFTKNLLPKESVAHRANWLYSKFDEAVHISPEAFDKFPGLAENKLKYENNNYSFSNFSDYIFRNPLINEILYGKSDFPVNEILDFIINGYTAKIPHNWVSLYEWTPEKQREKNGPLEVFANSECDTATLIWMLIKSGFKSLILEQLDKFPLFFYSNSYDFPMF